jgi:hypothetical protein
MTDGQNHSAKRFSNAIKKLDALAESRGISQGTELEALSPDKATDLLYDIGCLISILGTTAANISISLSKSIQEGKTTKKGTKKNNHAN